MYIRHVLIYMTIAIGAKYSFGQNYQCMNEIRTGEFYYEGLEDSARIVRTINQQIEVFNNGKSKLILNIEWISASTYILIHQEAINAPGCLKKGDTIKCTILNCKDDYYIYTYSTAKCGSGRSILFR